MNPLSRYFSPEVYTQLQSAGELRVFDSGSLDIAFYQWLLAMARQQVRVQLLLAQSEANLTPAYINNLINAGSLVLELPANARLSALSFIIFEGMTLVAETNTERQAKAFFRHETNPAVAAKFSGLFDRLLEMGRLTTTIRDEQPAKRPPLNDHSSAHAGKQPAIHFHASPQKVEVGRPFELAWDVPWADEVLIEPLIGKASNRGSRMLTLEKSALFTLTAAQGDRRHTSAVKVEVDTRPKIMYFVRVAGHDGLPELTLQHNPELPDHFGVIRGQTLELSWHVYHAERFLLDGEELPLVGKKLLNPEVHNTYHLIAEGGLQKTEVALHLDVLPKPEITRIELPEAGALTFNTAVHLPDAPPGIILEKPSATPPKENPASPPPRNRAQRLREFCWFCAGVNRDIIRECPASESVKYTGIGLAVFFTGLLAVLSGGYALYTAFGSVWAALAFGLLWGALIFNLDRLVVSSMKKDDTPGRQWTQAIPRFLLAIVLSIVIAKPLELRIFKPEIDAVVASRQLARREKISAMFDATVSDMEKRIGQIKSETDRSFSIRENLYQEYRCECDGTCGTGKVGRGTECERKEQKYRQADQEYQALKAENDGLIARIRSDAAAIETQKQQELAKLDGSRSDGLLARLDASGELPLIPGLFLILLILMVEIAPVLSKLLTPRGVYDHAIKLAEARFMLEQETMLQEAQLKSAQQSSLKVQLEQAELAQQIDQKSAILRLVADAHLQLVKDQVDDWLRKEREKRRGQ